LMERLSTGIKGLDEMIEGGIKAKSINLVVGEPGSGKSTFAVQFLLAGAKAGETGLYISVEEQRDKFFDNMKRYSFDLESLEREGKLVFHKTSTQEIRNFLDKGVISFGEYFQTYQIKRVVIDSATALMLAYNSETSQRSAIMNLLEQLAKWGATVLITSESDDGQARFGLEYLVDGIFRLYYRKVGQERVRTLEVFKMRGTDHSKQEIIYKLGNGGITLVPGGKILI
jgi:circadian clock protein KaiC